MNWENIYQLPFLFTTETKLRVFQIKFLHRRIATNDFLLKIGKKETDTFSFCADSPETFLGTADQLRLFGITFHSGPMKILIWQASLPSHQLFASAWLTVYPIFSYTTSSLSLDTIYIVANYEIHVTCHKCTLSYNLGQNCWENCILGQHFSKHCSCTGSSLSPFPWKQCCCVFKRKPDPWAFVGSNIELGEGVFFLQRRRFENSFVA